MSNCWPFTSPGFLTGSVSPVFSLKVYMRSISYLRHSRFVSNSLPSEAVYLPILVVVCAAVWRSAVVSCGWRRVGRRWRCCGVAVLAAQVSAGRHSNCSRAGSAPVGAREGVPGLPRDVSFAVATAGRPFLRPP